MEESKKSDLHQFTLAILMPASQKEREFKVILNDLPQPLRVDHFSVGHDDGCPLLTSTGPCNCNQEIEVFMQPRG